MNTLEQEFCSVVDSHLDEIKAKVDEASKVLKEATKLSEKYGIPFYSHISPIGQSYNPSSFSKKFPGLDEDIVSDLTASHSEYSGWQHSAVC